MAQNLFSEKSDEFDDVVEILNDWKKQFEFLEDREKIDPFLPERT